MSIFRGVYSTQTKSALVSELGRAWTEDFQSLERQRKTDSEPLSIRAGDVVFWHSLLAHGGSLRINPKLSRHSVVFHFIGRNTKLYTFKQFMLYDRDRFFRSLHKRVICTAGRIRGLHYRPASSGRAFTIGPCSRRDRSVRVATIYCPLRVPI
jgi:hypothetical protein